MFLKEKLLSNLDLRLNSTNSDFFSSLLDNVSCQSPRLEILPTQSPQRRPVGKQMMVTCQAKVDNPDLITDLRWRGQDGMNIMPKQ